MDLKPINRGDRDNRYCGPAVVSFITGANTSEVAMLIRRHRVHETPVRGTYDGELRAALQAYGYDIKAGPGGVGKTIAQWLRYAKAERTSGRVFLIGAGHHWQLITGRRYACGRIGDVVSVRDKRIKKRCRVMIAYEVVRLP